MFESENIFLGFWYNFAAQGTERRILLWNIPVVVVDQQSFSSAIAKFVRGSGNVAIVETCELVRGLVLFLHNKFRSGRANGFPLASLIEKLPNV